METNLTVRQPDDLQLTATVPQEMIEAQSQLMEWCANKIRVIMGETKELKAAFEHAKIRKWKHTTLERHWKRSEKKLQYYKKINGALLQGYYIVPNFPVQMFAIRTERNAPLKMYSHSYWGDKKQDPQELEAGKGEYKNPFPIVDRREWKDMEQKTQSRSHAEWWDDLEFPITMAKPQIMEAVDRAMALKIFDQFGIMPATKKEDPIIIAQIVNKQSQYSDKIISFMIAWHLNTNVI